jgi:hypothetical protein
LAENQKKKFESPIDLRDVIVFGGIALASYGSFLVYKPAAFIVAGAALFVVGYFTGGMSGDSRAPTKRAN